MDRREFLYDPTGKVIAVVYEKGMPKKQVKILSEENMTEFSLCELVDSIEKLRGICKSLKEMAKNG